MKIENLIEKSYIKPYLDLVHGYDTETYQHSINVAKIACIILEAYPDLIEEQTKIDTVTGALLHDIGKTIVPVTIIRKKEPLSKLDHAFIRQHPLNGLRMVQEEHFGEVIENIILKHHEKLNGEGYPCQYDMEEIEEPVRIISVADVYSALTEHRSYKRALNIRDSLMILDKAVRKGDLDEVAYDSLVNGLKFSEKFAI